MKTAYVIFALVALAVMAVAPVGAYNGNDNRNTGCVSVCPSGSQCQSAAFQTSPLPTGECPTLNNITRTQEWQDCGAFCAAGQTPTGWPFGWNDEYWLRPDSNY